MLISWITNTSFIPLIYLCHNHRLTIFFNYITLTYFQEPPPNYQKPWLVFQSVHPYINCSNQSIPPINDISNPYGILNPWAFIVKIPYNIWNSTIISENRVFSLVSDSEIISDLPVLLSGIARLWYRNTKDTDMVWKTWDEFEFAFRCRFSDEDLDHRVKDQICTWTQCPKERIADYITCLMALFNK